MGDETKAPYKSFADRALDGCMAELDKFVDENALLVGALRVAAREDINAHAEELSRENVEAIIDQWKKEASDG